MTESKPNHSHGKYDTATRFRPGPSDTLIQAIDRFGAENLIVERNYKGCMILEECDTGLTVWSDTEKVEHETVMQLLGRIGVSQKGKT